MAKKGILHGMKEAIGRKVMAIGLLVATTLLLMADFTFAARMLGPSVSYSTNGTPLSMTAGDLNKDNIPDLITVNYNQYISILIGNGDGTFKQSIDYYIGNFPSDATIADFNGDGNPDIVTVNNIWQSYSVLLGNGDGTFQIKDTYYMRSVPWYVTSADFNGDDKMDFAHTVAFGAVAIHLGNGDGTFQAEVLFDAGASYVGSIIAKDFNQDGFTDIAAPHLYSGGVSIILGNGDGTFQSPVTYQTSPELESISADDFNADGIIDIVSANGNDTVSVLIGNGDGTFQSHVDYETRPDPKDVATGDFNGDGRVDIVVSGHWWDYTYLSVFLGNGNGTFQPRQDFITFTFPEGATNIIAADFNGDKMPDVAISTWVNIISVMLNRYNEPNEPPVANAGIDRRIECSGHNGTLVLLDGSSSYDLDGDPLTYKWAGSFPEGGGTVTGVQPTVTLPVGIWDITLTVNDGEEDSVPDVVTVVVNDTTPPIVDLSVSPTMLWPPDHRYINIDPVISVFDSCDPAPRVISISVKSNEQDDSTGDGEFVNDIIIKDGRISLRAERDGAGKGRVYTIEYTTSDSSGNSTSSTASVIVPHDKGN